MSDDENGDGKDIISFEGTMENKMKIANMLANSNFVPKTYRGFPGDILAAVQMGQEVGLKPMAALQGIAVINGRPSIWGDAMIGLVRQSPLCEYIKEEFNHDTMTATCTAKRIGEPAQSREFSAHDAETAGLWTKPKPSPWFHYPKVMLKHRARGFCLRDLFPDVLKGLSLGEEMEDYPDLKQINEAPAKPAQSDKASKAASFIKDQIDEAEIEDVIDYSALIENCESIEALVTLKTELVQIEQGEYCNQLMAQYNAKGRDLYQQGVNL